MNKLKNLKISRIKKSEDKEVNLDWIHGTKTQLQTLKENLNKLPDKLQIKHLKNSVGYVQPKGLKDFLDEVLSGSIYEKKITRYIFTRF